MAHSQSFAAKTISSLERARQEVHGFKTHIAQLLRSQHPQEQAVGRQLVPRVQQADVLVQKAEATFKRIKKSSLLPSRPTASIPASVRAKRSLSVLLSAVGPHTRDLTPNEASPKKDGETNGQPEAENDTDPTRNVKQRTEAPRSVGRSFPFLSFAGKPAASPIREEDLPSILAEIGKETELAYGRLGNGGVIFECRNVFRAMIWFKEVEASSSTEADNAGTDSNSTYILPEHVGCFGVDETKASRWACSRHAVFNIITERANAATRYYMAREETAKGAFVSLVRWLARHKTLFSSKCDERRLAFDSARGMFLPACIYPFEGNDPPRFPRASIPVRSSSSYGGQATMYVPSNNNAQATAAQGSSQPNVGRVSTHGNGGANGNVAARGNVAVRATAASGVRQTEGTASVVGVTSSNAAPRDSDTSAP